MSPKFVGKYMRMAKQVGEDNNPCYSRKIGVVVVRVYKDENGETTGKVLGTGYNGPPRKTPHCDQKEYLREIFWPQLDPVEKAKAVNAANMKVTCGGTCSTEDAVLGEWVSDVFAGSKTCPRKIIGAPSGTRLELCSCAHAETNAIVNSSDDLYGAFMFCYCGVPCAECAKLIINAGVKKVFVIDWGGDYSHSSRWLFQKAGVEIIQHPPDYYLSLGD